MIKLVSWNIARKKDAWRELAGMARRGEADVALLQEAGRSPDDVGHPLHYENDTFRKPNTFAGWPLVVKLSNRVSVEWFRQVPPDNALGEHEVGASCIGTFAAATVTPYDRPEKSLVAVSM